MATSAAPRTCAACVLIGSVPDDRLVDVRVHFTDRRLTEFSGWRPQRRPETVLADIHEWIRREEDSLRPVLLGA